MFILLALSSAVFVGAWSFGVGRFTRVMPAKTVVILSGTAALVCYLVFGGLTGSLIFDASDVLPGLIAGLLNLAGTLMSLQAYRLGKLGVVSGINKLYVVVPLIYSFFIGEAISVLTGVGMVVMLVGVVLFSISRDKGSETTSNSRTFILFALGSALLWGLAVIVLDIGSRVNIYGTLSVNQGIQIVILLTFAAASRTSLQLQARAVLPLFAVGAALALSNITFYTAAGMGDIGTVSILTSLSPVVTAGLALLLLKERMNRLEVGALLVVLIGTCLVVA